MTVIPRLDKKTQMKVLCDRCGHHIADLPEGGTGGRKVLLLDPGHKQVAGERFTRWTLTEHARKRWQSDRVRAAHQRDPVARQRLADRISTRNRRPVTFPTDPDDMSNPTELRSQNFHILEPPAEIVCRNCLTINVVETQWFSRALPHRFQRKSEPKQPP